ncbi:polysaccharide pyruvyl transferase family protein [Coleofasciculus sp.]|uniref:polysaccharide pyruvyl transferase family protein n=1 Tax=Coleofasciculus sp. TaxID=3100458 RepID=UPI003A3658FF
MKICLFDPGIENNNGSPSANLGDLIIQEAVERELNNIFENSSIVHISTHTFPHQEHIRSIRSCSISFVGGTNLLNSKMNIYKKWKVSGRQQLMLKKAILMGVGWQFYQHKPNFYTSILLKMVLSRKFFHSVRDSYTKRQLQLAGISNVINTGCPTMWPLMNIRSEDIPSTKSASALVMLTDYSKDYELDKKLLNLISCKYEKVFIWSQGRGDKEYISQLVSAINIPVVMLEHSLSSFNNLLNSGIPFDYIGTRLHGGVKCLLSRKRALVIEIDNRAAEIAKDTNLPTTKRSDFQYINHWIETPLPTEIKIDSDAVYRWKSQFIYFEHDN